MNKYNIKATVLLLMTALSLSSHAALNVDRTRLIYVSNQSSISLTISNDGKDPHLMQSWIENEDGKKINEPIIALPLLQRIDPQQKKQVRITTIGNKADLASDKETLFYYNVLEVPPKLEKKEESALQIAIQSRLKLFYRPAQLADKNNNTWQKSIKITHQQDTVSIENESPYYVILVYIGNKDYTYKDKNFSELILKPYSTTTYSFKGNIPKNLLLSYVNDFGAYESLSYVCDNTLCLQQD